jgi:hypothetical protein
LFSLLGLVFMVWCLAWCLVWIFNALKVSTNLKGYRLGILYCVGVFGGDVLTRFIIGWFY